DDFLGEVRPDSFDQAGAEEASDALDGVRRCGSEGVGLELQAVVAVLHPGAGRFDVFPSDRVGQVAGDRYDALMSAGVNTQHREPRVEVVERHALNHAGQGLGHEGIVSPESLAALHPTEAARPTPSVVLIPLASLRRPVSTGLST